ncbi:MAG: ankyrin repeat domain-containing protein [Candidatus Babeliales bacterium]|jgi:ankyrin repeat protein
MITKNYTLALITIIAATSSLVAMEPGEKVITPDTVIESGAPVATPQTNPYVSLSQEDKDKLLIQAVKNNDLEDTKALLNAGAKPDAEEISHKCDARRHHAINKITPILVFAIRSKNIPMVKELIDCGANINTNMMESKGDCYSATDSLEITEVIKPLLVLAIESGSSELVHLLIDHKVNLNQRCVNIVWRQGSSVDGKIEGYSTSYETPLSRAIELGNTEIAKMLKDAGVIEYPLMDNVLYMSMPLVV